MPRRCVPPPKIVRIYSFPFAFALAAAGLVGMLLHVAFGSVLLLLATPFALHALDRTLLIRALRRHEFAGVVVTSNSPVWGQYIEETWLPRIDGKTAWLNWSERRNWDKSDPWVQAYNRFGASDREYCPSAILVVNGRPLVFRFYNAFKNAKHGNCEGLRKLESALFEVLEE